MQLMDILSLLQRGDRRTLGRADQVAAMVGKGRRLFPKLIAGLWSEDPLVRMRAADAAEKVTREVPRLPLNVRERQKAISVLQRYLQDRSSIVKTFALQGLSDLAPNEPAVIEILREAARTGTAAMKARSRKLLSGI